MKKLRLLVTELCDRDCKLCVNKQFDIENLPTPEAFAGYEEIILTGGEPLLVLDRLDDVISRIRQQNKWVRIWVHTAMCNNFLSVYKTLFMFGADGITLTVHSRKDLRAFIDMESILSTVPGIDTKSLKLVVSGNVPMPAELKCNWNAKRIKMLEDCHLPEGEVFMKVS